MPDYRVIWEVDVTANHPRDAAREALKMMKDPESEAVVFEVCDLFAGGKWQPGVEIDLIDDKEQQHGWWNKEGRTASTRAGERPKEA